MSSEREGEDEREPARLLSMSDDDVEGVVSRERGAVSLGTGSATEGSLGSLLAVLANEISPNDG